MAPTGAQASGKSFEDDLESGDAHVRLLADEHSGVDAPLKSTAAARPSAPACQQIVTAFRFLAISPVALLLIAMVAAGGALSIAILSPGPWVAAIASGSRAEMRIEPGSCANRGFATNSSTNGYIVVTGPAAVNATASCAEVLTPIVEAVTEFAFLWATGQFKQSDWQFGPALAIAAAANLCTLAALVALVFRRAARASPAELASGCSMRVAVLELPGPDDRIGLAARGLVMAVAPLALIPAVVAAALWVIAGLVADMGVWMRSDGPGIDVAVTGSASSVMALASAAMVLCPAAAAMVLSAGPHAAGAAGRVGGCVGVAGGLLLVALIPQVSPSAIAVSECVGVPAACLGLIAIAASFREAPDAALADPAAPAAAAAAPKAPESPTPPNAPPTASGSPCCPQEPVTARRMNLLVFCASCTTLSITGCPGCFLGLGGFIAGVIGVALAAPLAVVAASTWLPGLAASAVSVLLHASLAVGVAAVSRGPLAVVAAVVSLASLAQPAVQMVTAPRSALTGGCARRAALAVVLALGACALTLVWAIGTVMVRTTDATTFSVG